MRRWAWPAAVLAVAGALYLWGPSGGDPEGTRRGVPPPARPAVLRPAPGATGGAGSVSGRVTDGRGEPVVGEALVLEHAGAFPVPIAEVRSGRRGAFLIPEVPRGQHVLRLARVGARRALILGSPAHGLSLSTGGEAAVVVRATLGGRPFGPQGVVAFAGTDAPLAVFGPAPGAAPGEVVLEGLPAGRVSVAWLGPVPRRHDLDLVPGERRALAIDGDAGSLVIRAVDASDGAPLDGARAWFVDAGDGERSDLVGVMVLGQVAPTQPTRGGRLEVTALGERPLRTMVAAPGYRAAVLEGCRPDGGVVVAALERGGGDLRVSCSDPGLSVAVLVYDAAGRRLFHRWCEAGRTGWPIAVPPLGPGDYRVRLVAPGLGERELVARLEDGGESTVEVPAFE
ncbi:MAG: carboxypeptidase regulatory-like domain-containing protein [Planctomycetes bacterium]|nr:carboxypeptidase regulatory-like domain-containing protein [Planctomycetota bacterium]